MNLRPYQLEAVAAAHEHLRTRPVDECPCIVLPTGAGKTPVLATIANDVVGWGGRPVIVTHVKELVQQSAERLRSLAGTTSVGVYSAGLGKRQLRCPITVAGIQSIHERARDLGRVDLIVIDEAHLVPPKGDGLYRRFIASVRSMNPHVRVLGLTATAFRTKTGPLCGPRNIFRSICYEIGVKDLIAQGYLSPLVTAVAQQHVDTSGLRVQAGEFVAREVEALMDRQGLVRGACAEIVAHTRDRRGTLIFASGVAHAHHLAEELIREHGVECGVVVGETPSRERAALIARFRTGQLRYLCSVGVLTTGFDAPHVDCVALVRPTHSPGLYYQMCGRGFRLAEGKADCLVLDFGNNIERHGPVDGVWKEPPSKRRGNGQPTKTCPECGEELPTACRECPECGCELPLSELLGAVAAKGASVISAEDGPLLPNQHRVVRTTYALHMKRRAIGAYPPLPSLRVHYEVDRGGTFVEWICVEHPRGSYPRMRAESWWAARSHAPFPKSAADALDAANAGELATTRRITVRKSGLDKFPRILSPILGPRPEWPPPATDERDAMDEQDELDDDGDDAAVEDCGVSA